jgi:endonuclease-3
VKKAAVKQAAVKRAKPRLAKHKLLKSKSAKPPHKPKVATRATVNADPARAAEIYSRLQRAYPDAHCALDHRNAFELLVATILSAQCTDKRVNMVTPTLFAKYPDASHLAVARQEEVEELIRSTGFFRNKATNLIAMANALVDRHGGNVPSEMDALVKLPGVGRKTANVVLGNAFGINEGIVVDTHVARLSNRLGFVAVDDPVKIEAALMPLFPRHDWTMLSHLLIEHGRQTCDARKPRCGVCPVRALCPSALV